MINNTYVQEYTEPEAATSFSPVHAKVDCRIIHPHYLPTEANVIYIIKLDEVGPVVNRPSTD